MIGGLEALAIEHIIRIEHHMEEAVLGQDRAGFVDAAEAVIFSVSVLKVGQLDIVALGLRRTLVHSFHVERVKRDLHSLARLLRPEEIVVTQNVARIQARIVRRREVAVSTHRAIKIHFTITRFVQQTALVHIYSKI